jgi:hypothetical protein
MVISFVRKPGGVHRTPVKSDVFSVKEIRPERVVIAPRQHFTNHRSLPARDRKELLRAVLAEVATQIASGYGEITIRPVHGEAGHIAYEVASVENVA